MSDDLLPIDLDLSRPRRKKVPSAKKLLEQIDDLRQEREGLLERCKLAESAACQNLSYAQAAREAMEELAERIEKKLDDMAKQPKA
jgi:hypothetical protein